MAALAALCLCAPALAHANLKYIPDPVYKKLNPDDPHPMDDMLNLAKSGDARAQFIVADMNEKEKGGFARDIKEARHWFEESAMHGYPHSFIRLAAIAKREKKPVEAWAWYTLGIDAFDYGDEQAYVIKARHDLVEAAELTPDEISEGRKFVNGWKDKRDDTLREEREAERLRKKQEKLEKLDKANENLGKANENFGEASAVPDKLAVTAAPEKKKPIEENNDE
jgi:TPR repeat protein